MKALPTKLIIRYRPEDLDQHLNKFGLVQIVNALNKPELVPETAIVESSGIEGIEELDEIIVSYIISWDTSYKEDELYANKKRNQYFIDKDETGERRYCFADHVYGIRRNGKITPTKGYVFCELPEKPYEYQGKIIIPEIYQKQDTDNKGFRAKIKHIREEDSENLNLHEGDLVWCTKNTDAKKKVWGEELIRVPLNMVLAKDGEKGYPLELKPLAT